MKIKGYRFPCEVCGDNKVVSSIQVFFRKNGEVSYARARHFGADKNFYYHQQSLEYTSSKLRTMVGLPGFEPESIEPKSTSLDQASRQPQSVAEKIISNAS